MDFYEANAIAKQGEQHCKQLLEHRGWNLIDCSNHKFFQINDIDFVIEKDNQVITLDVKTDTHPPNNLFIEILSNDTKNTAGCIYTSAADWWLYYFVNYGAIYAFEPSKMVEEIEQNDYRTVSGNTTIDGNTIYKSIGVLVPIEKSTCVTKLKGTLSYELTQTI